MKRVVKPALVLLATLLLMFSLLAISLTTRTIAHAKSNLLPGITSGLAYAGYLQVPAGKPVVSVGPEYPAGLGCPLSSKTVTVTAASMSLAGFVSSGAVTDTATTTRTPTRVTTQASSDVQGLNILGGLIRANDVKTVANSDATSTSASSSGSSTFAGLVVDGNHESDTPPPNTTLTLAGLGSVTLNEQVGPTNGANVTSISVTAIDVSITQQNSYGLPVGTHILIAHALTSFVRTPILAAVPAEAWGAFSSGKAQGAFVPVGPFAVASVGCSGGSSKASVPGANLPGVGSTGTITDTASGVIQPTGASANSSSTVQQMNFLGGLISATTTMSSAQASSNGTASATVTLTNAMVAGIPLAAHPSPNTVIPIPLLGYVVVNEQRIIPNATEASADVNAFDLFITMTNVFGLPVGSRVIEGHADATVFTG